MRSGRLTPLAAEEGPSEEDLGVDGVARRGCAGAVGRRAGGGLTDPAAADGHGGAAHHPQFQPGAGVPAAADTNTQLTAAPTETLPTARWREDRNT